jgi:hypothetical protein
VLEFTRREKWFIGLIYAIPIAVLFAALIMAFTHAMEWAARHDSGPGWEHLAFALMIEFPALLGLLLMTLWPKIGGGRKPVVPRILFLVAAALSQFVQQAYAGSDASTSSRFVAGVPSVGAMVFIEIVFWVMGLVDESKHAAKRNMAGPAPALVPPPPPMEIPLSPLANAPSLPEPAPQDSALPAPPVSPWASPPASYAEVNAAPLDMLPLQQGEHEDKPQVTATVPPTAPPSAGGEQRGEQDLPELQDNAVPLPTNREGSAPLDDPEEDTDLEGSSEGDTVPAGRGSTSLDPTDLEMWAHHQNGKTKAELAVMYGCHEKTIQRRLSKVRKATAKNEEHADA